MWPSGYSAKLGLGSLGVSLGYATDVLGDLGQVTSLLCTSVFPICKTELMVMLASFEKCYMVELSRSINVSLCPVSLILLGVTMPTLHGAVRINRCLWSA